MSIVVPSENLDRDQRESIYRDLRITTESTDFMKMKFASTKSKVICFYQVIGDQVFVPMRYGTQLLSPDLLSFRHWEERVFKWKGELREHQVGPARVCIQLLSKNKTAILGAYPSFGKTVVGNLIAALLKRRTLVLTPRGNIGDQWLFTNPHKLSRSCAQS